MDLHSKILDVPLCSILTPPFQVDAPLGYPARLDTSPERALDYILEVRNLLAVPFKDLNALPHVYVKSRLIFIYGKRIRNLHQQNLEINSDQIQNS